MPEISHIFLQFTIINSIKIFNKVLNEELIIACAAITKINQNRDVSLVIVD